MGYLNRAYIGVELPRYARRLAAGTYDFIALGYGRARRVVCMSDGTWSVTKYAKDVAEDATDASAAPNLAVGAVTAGFDHDTAGVVALTFTGEVLAYFD